MERQNQRKSRTPSLALPLLLCSGGRSRCVAGMSLSLPVSFLSVRGAGPGFYHSQGLLCYPEVCRGQGADPNFHPPPNKGSSGIPSRKGGLRQSNLSTPRSLIPTPPLAEGLVNKWQDGRAPPELLTLTREFQRTVKSMESFSAPKGPSGHLFGTQIRPSGGVAQYSDPRLPSSLPRGSCAPAGRPRTFNASTRSLR